MTLHDEVSEEPAFVHMQPDFRGADWSCLHCAIQVEIEDMEWNDELQAFTYQCPCGDLFQITLDELAAGGRLACARPCWSCRGNAGCSLRL